MLGENRKEIIIKLLNKQGTVKVADLQKIFNTSLQTVRRDLEILEKEGVIKKVYGGAILNKSFLQPLSLETREKSSLNEKDEISNTALKFIDEGDSIALNDSTTNLMIAKKLSEHFKNLTIITNSLEIISTLSEVKGFNVILAGGILNSENKAFYGEITENILDKFVINKAFICVSSFSLKNGITDYPLEEVKIQQKLMEISQNSFIIADSNKLESSSLIKVRDISEKEILITDHNIPKEIEENYKNAKITIIK